MKRINAISEIQLLEKSRRQEIRQLVKEMKLAGFSVEEVYFYLFAQYGLRKDIDYLMEEWRICN